MFCLTTGVNNQLWILDTMEATLQGQVRCNRCNLSAMVFYVLKQQLELANPELITRYNIMHNAVVDDPTNQLMIRFNTRYVLSMSNVLCLMFIIFLKFF